MSERCLSFSNSIHQLLPLTENRTAEHSKSSDPYPSQMLSSAPGLTPSSELSSTSSLLPTSMPSAMPSM
eukprot:11462444-Ditylum_brightwellii.AAC.1